MKYIQLIFFCLFNCCYCYGQPISDLQNLSGKVLDSVSLKPLPFVTVTLKSGTDSTAKYTLTDSAGIYLFKQLLHNTYFLKFSMAGYRSGQISDIKVDSNSTLKDYVMAPASIQLAAVTITAGKTPISPRIDGFTYDARRESPVAGESASDLLRKLPAVMVSPEGTPSIRGSSAIKVFIDDRPSEAFASSITEALRQVPSGNISRIEVITQPSARYDAEGVDAVILIFTKKPVDKGFSGSVNAQISNRNSSVTPNLNIRQNKWITSIGAGYYYNNNPSGNEVLRTENNGARYLRQQRENRAEANSIFASVNTLYRIDSLSSWNAGYRYGKFWGEERNQFVNVLSSGSGINEFTRNINSTPGNHTNTLNAGYVKKSKDRKTELNILGLYFYQKQAGKYVLEQRERQLLEYRESNRTATDNQEISIQADLTKETRNKSILETGIKATYRDFNNSSNFGVYDFDTGNFIPDDIRSNNFWFGRTIVAGYASYLFNLDKWKVRTGLRYEQTVLKLRFSEARFKIPDYKNLLPSILISRNSSNGQQFSLGYSKKLLRPYIAYMNPVVNYIDSLNLEFGNPRLRPVVTHAVEVAHTYITRAVVLSSSLFYNQNNNSIENIRSLKPGGIVESTYLNVASNRVFGGILSLSFRSGKWSANTNHMVRNITFKSRLLTTAANGTVSSHYLNLGYKFDPTFSAELSGTLNAGQVNFQSTVSGSQWYSILVSKTFSKGKSGISLRLDNIATPTQYVTEEIIGDTFQQRSRRNFPLLLTRIGFFYKIGKKEVQVPTTRRISNDN
jgi:hypothetical protein